MNILVTGSSGFIGKNLIKQLLKSENRVIYGIDINSSELKHPKLINIEADLASPDWVELLPEHIDTVIHLAQSRYYRDFPDRADDMFKVNVQSFFQLLNWSREYKVKRVLFASTGNVYQRSDSLLTESDPYQPDSFYAATKLCAENLMQQYSNFFSTIIMRFFSVYGPGQTNMLIPNIIEKMKKNQEIQLADNIGIYVTPIYIDDCVQIINKLVECDHLSRMDIINIAGNSVVSLADIIHIIEKNTGLSPKLKLKKEKPSSLIGSNKKITGLLKYSPKMKVSDGIIKVIDALN